MSKLKRQIQRKAAKDAKKELQAKMGLFDKLENSCLVCEKEFDKTSKEMVTSWMKNTFIQITVKKII